MKKFLSILFIVLSGLTAFSQTTPLTVTTIAKAQPDFTYTPGRGSETWNFQNQVDVPVQGTNTSPAQDYIRYCWYQLQSGSAASAGASMTFTQLDNDFHAAITAGRTVRIGLLLNFGDQAPNTVGGALLVYPLALHNLMQGETIKDHNDGGYWDENPNSAFWLQWLTSLLNNTANHINTTSFNGVPYTSVLKSVDIRICGAYGEGAVNNGEPFGTVAGLNAIIDAYKAAFPNVFLNAMIGNFSGGIPGPTGIGITPLGTSTYILSQSNAKGKFGVRRDNWGNPATYIRNWTDLNPNVDGFRYDTTIQNRWKYAPVTGEPEGSGDNMADLLAEVDRMHATRVGNGNYGGNSSATLSNNMRAAFLEMGYRWQINSGTSTTAFVNGATSNITMQLQNVGISPSYDHWTEFFELKTPAGVVVASWNGTFDPYLIIPGTYTNSTNFTITGVANATNYNLFVTFKDALGYMKPMPLANTLVQTNGSYLIRSNVSVNPGTSTPIANAGTDQTITLPVSSVTLSGSGSTGTITSYLWTTLSGPNTPTIVSNINVTSSVSGLIAGTYVFDLSLNGGVSHDQVTVFVNPVPPPPPPVPTGITIITIQTLPTVLSTDGTALELGTKFRSTKAGFISGIRFLKVAGNTGTHIGQLYTVAGVLLASATFTSETASGWQEVTFATPVAIAANTTYVAAYFSPNGFYTFSPNYLGTAITNTPLSALADGTDGHNAVYLYTGSPAFPNQYTANNNKPYYWVDVRFYASTPITTQMLIRPRGKKYWKK